MKDGMINTDSEGGKEIGFTSDLFDGYLWKNNEDIYISFIISLQEGKGNLRRLFDNILKAGFNIKIPTPFPRMESIIKKLGFIHTQVSDKNFCYGETVEIWIKNK